MRELPLIEANLERAELPQRYILTVALIVSAPPSQIKAAEQRACEACIAGFLKSEISALQANATSFRYEPDPRNA